MINITDLIAEFDTAETFNKKLLCAIKLFSNIENISTGPVSISLIDRVKCYLLAVSDGLQKEVLPPNYYLDDDFKKVMKARKDASLLAKKAFISAQPEAVVLWRLLGNHLVQAELAVHALDDDSIIVQQKIDRYNNAILDYLDEQYLRALHSYSWQPTADLIALGGEDNKHRLWAASTMLAMIITSKSKNILLASNSSLYVIYILLSNIDCTSFSVIFIFNLLNFVILFDNFNKLNKNKYNNLLDLLWYRLALAFWYLSVDPAIQLERDAVNNILLKQFKINFVLKDKFFKIIALYCFHQILNKELDVYKIHSDKLRLFFMDLFKSGFTVGNEFDFLQFLFKTTIADHFTDLITAAGTISDELLVLKLYKLYIKYLTETTAVKCPVLSSLISITADQTMYIMTADVITKSLRDEIELSKQERIKLLASKSTAESTAAAVNSDLLKLRSVHQTVVTDRDRAVARLAEVEPQYDTYCRAVVKARKQLESALETLEADILVYTALLVPFDTKLANLEQLRNKFIITYCLLFSYKNFEDKEFNNYLINYLTLVYKIFNIIFTDWDILVTSYQSSKIRHTAEEKDKLLQRQLMLINIRVSELADGDLELTGTTAQYDEFFARISVIESLARTTSLISSSEQALRDFVCAVGSQLLDQQIAPRKKLVL